MLGKLYNSAAVVALATLLAGGGFAAYLFGSGKLDAERTERIAAILRGEPLQSSEPEDKQTEADQTADSDAPVRNARSAEEIQRTRQRDRLRRAVLDRAGADADARRALADQMLQHALSVQEEIEASKTAWDERVRKMNEAAQDEGFQRELKIVSKLSTKLAKEHIVLTWQKHKADAVRLLREMNPSKVTRILEQFKTPEDRQVAHELLEQLRLQSTKPDAPRSGRTAGDASN